MSSSGASIPISSPGVRSRSTGSGPRPRSAPASAATLGIDAKLAALGISEMVDENMSNAARTHAVEWGKGVAGRTLIAFGGSAPIHAARLADKLEVNRFLVPADAGVGSAVGFLLAPISYEVVRSRYMRLSGFDPGVVREAFD